MRKRVELLVAVLAVLALFGCGSKHAVPSSGSTAPTFPRTIAQEASSGVGAVGRTANGSNGAPVMVLEELHNSRAGQIQHAVTLVRLHGKDGLKNIALEGYLKDGPPVDTGWFVRANPGGDALARARVAVRFIEEGEISAAEFIKLVYPDVELAPTETKATYNVQVTADAFDSLIAYLSKLSDAGDSLAQTQSGFYQDPNAIVSRSAEEHLAVALELERRAKALGIRLTPKQQRSWQDYLDFWRSRIAGSKLIVGAADSIADRQGVSVVAMEIGSAHTDGICKMLLAESRPFAVITPLATKNGDTRGDLTDAFQRKYNMTSVFSKGFTNTLVKLFPPARAGKKPPPILSQGWFKSKGELYADINRIANGVLGNATGAGGPPTPPGPPRTYGFSEDDFRSDRVFINPKLIAVLPEGNHRAVLFPAVLDPNRHPTTLWVKAAVMEGSEYQQETVEAMLLAALKQVQSETVAPNSAEDRAGRVQVSVNTYAAVGLSKAAVERVVLGAS